MVWCDGTQYDGDWLANERTGSGVLLSRDGSIHRGLFVGGKRHGKGQVRSAHAKMFPCMCAVVDVLFEALKRC
jgi:MORN repeat